MWRLNYDITNALKYSNSYFKLFKLAELVDDYDDGNCPRAWVSAARIGKRWITGE